MAWKRMWVWNEDEHDNCATLCCYLIVLVVSAAVVAAPVMVVVGTITPNLLEYPSHDVNPASRSSKNGLWLKCTELEYGQNNFHCQHFYWPDVFFGKTAAHQVRSLQSFGLLSTVCSLLVLASPLVMCYRKDLGLPVVTLAFILSACVDTVFVSIFWRHWDAIGIAKYAEPGWSAIIATVGFGFKALFAVVGVCLSCNSYQSNQVTPPQQA